VLVAFWNKEHKMKNKKQFVRVEDVRELVERIRAIRKIDIKDAVFIYRGKITRISKKIADDWGFCGLGLDYFVMNHRWRDRKKCNPNSGKPGAPDLQK
jgi:hypothetical protein